MKKRPVIIDTDPGIEDAVALAIALFSKELDVRLITTVAGNAPVDTVTWNMLKLLKFYEKEVPVAQGAAQPLLHPAVLTGAGLGDIAGFKFEEPDTHLLLDEHAVQSMARVINESRQPVTLVSIAPLTNIALLLRTYPQAREKIDEIILMGGPASRGNKGILSEFNIAADPEAAKIVFSSRIPLVMAGIDVSWKAMVLPEDSDALPDMGEIGRMAYGLFRKNRRTSMRTGLKIYDSCAIAYLLAPELFRTVDTFVDVELSDGASGGYAHIDFQGHSRQPSNARVCTDLDQQGFRSWFCSRIAMCG